MTENNTEVKKEVSEHFVSSIKKWLDLDDKIEKLRNEMKLMNNDKKEAEALILLELDTMQEKVINVGDNKLRKSISKTQGPLKKDHIQKSLFDFIKDEKKTHDLIDTMMKSRQSVEKINLKRIKNKTGVV